MVVEWLFDLIASLVTMILDLLPELPDTTWLTGDVASAVGTLSGFASQIGAFVPWSLIQGCMALVIASLAAAALIKIVRIVASFFTAGGGSAA